jgi:hypothetical protein
MTFRYKYLGDLPTVFIHLHDDNGTWMPSKNDEIEWHEAIAHPLLKLVSQDDDVSPVEVAKTESTPWSTFTKDDHYLPATEEPVTEEPVNEPAEPEITESPVSADDKEN